MIETSNRKQVIFGGLVHALSLREWQVLPRALIGISDTGTVEWLVENVHGSLVRETMVAKGWAIEDVDFVELGRNQWIMPGFVDTHTHAPQFPNMGVGGRYELLDWLKNVTFPEEAKFADLDYARKVYTSVVQRVLNCGTTTCCYYGSLHLEATKILADICLDKGQRAFVGKCNMDSNGAPNYQEPSAKESLAQTEALIAHIAAYPSSASSPLVQPILTPRFAIACSPDLLTGLGAIAARNPDMAIQTHISENASEIARTSELFPECASYAHVYDAYGLLRRKTILAHGVHLEKAELWLIKKKDAGISHCPTSNFNLRSGMADVGAMLDKGIKVGLGTDVSGGCSPSILTAIQHASICSKMLSLQPRAASSGSDTFTGAQLPIPTLLYLATLGGADLCGLASTVGNFVPGKEFDALLVDAGRGGEGMWIDDGGESIATEARLEALLEKFLFCGDSRNITTVWVRGSVVGGTAHGQ